MFSEIRGGILAKPGGRAGVISAAFIGIADVFLYLIVILGVSSLSPFENTFPLQNSQIAYVLFRMAYVGLLLCVQLAAGGLFLRALRLLDLHEHDALIRFLLDFICGAAILRALLFAVGVAGGIRFSLVFIIFAACLFLAGRYSPTRLILSLRMSKPSRENLLVIAGIAIVGVFFVLSWLRIGLLPFDGDYLSHYAQYLAETVREGVIAPNDVWYHFFYSKGDSTGMAAILLADPAGKLDVSTTYFIAALVALAKTLDWCRLPRPYIVLALITVVFTVGFSDIGIAAKAHMYVLFAIFSLAFCALGYNRTAYRPFGMNYLVGMACCLVQVWLASLVMSIFALGLIGLCFLWWAVGRRWIDAGITVVLGVGLCLLVAVMMGFNYLHTGLFEINPNRFFFQYADFSRLKDWISPYLITYLEQGSSASFGAFGLHFEQFRDNVAELVRWPILSILFPSIVLVIALLVLPAYLLMVGANRSTRFAIFLACGMVVITVLVLLVSGHSVSMVRAAAFLVPFMVILIVMGLFACEDLLIRSRDVRYVYQAVLFGVCCIALMTTFFYDRFAQAGSAYAKAEIDVDEAYHRSQLILPATTVAVELRRRFGNEIRILGLHLVANELGRAYVMGHGIKTEVSYGLGPDWHVIAFEEPDKAVRELVRQTDIVLINLESVGIGAIGFSPLMAPRSLSRYFKVVLSQGNWLALAFKDNSVTGRALTDRELSKWARARNTSNFRGIARNMGLIYKYNIGRVDDRPLLPPDLPAAKGWQ